MELQTAASWHIKTRREKIVKISYVDHKAVNAIGRIQPPAHGGGAAELEKVVELAKGSRLK